MKKHYENQLGSSFHVFHNGAKTNFFQKRAKPIQSPFVIRFLGSYFEFLHQDAIADVVWLVEKMNQNSLDIIFEFWGIENPEGAFQKYCSKNVRYKGAFNYEKEAVKLCQQSNLLLIPASFNEQSKAHYQFSFPTKLTECIASGTPTFVYGPEEMGSVEFCKKNKLGIVITENSRPQLENKFRQVFENYEDYLVKAEKDKNWIEQYYSLPVVRENFQRIIKKASNWEN